MHFKINYTKLFWILHIIGWLLFIAVDLFLYFDEYWHFPRFWFFLFSYFCLFWLILILRKIYSGYLKRFKRYKNIILLIFAGSLGLSLLWIIIDHLIFAVFNAGEKSIGQFIYEVFYSLIENGRIFKSIIFRMFPLIIWSLLYVALKIWFELTEEKEKREKAFLLAQQAQLNMLRYQLNPHFLFNSLSSIQALIYENKNIADKMLTELSEFLRYTLSHVNKTYVPLKEEFEAIKRYLTIEKIRFEEKLEYEISCSAEASNYKVLSFLIQPIIENAIKHGIKTSPIPLQLFISAQVMQHKLIISISNTGKWIPTQNDGTGITNLKERLENAYQHRHVFSINEKDNKVIVMLELEHKE